MTTVIRTEIQSLLAQSKYWEKKAAAHRKAAATNAASGERCSKKARQMYLKACGMAEAHNDNPMR